jgi:site-specific DNA recombinase
MSDTAVVYLRVSTTRQGEEGTSLETQLNGEPGCLAFCAERGLTVLDVYRDMHSGYDMERPGLEQALAAIRSRAASVLVVYALDRLSRNQNHQGNILTQLELAGATLHIVTEPDWEDSLQGRFLRSAAAFAAEMERSKLIERTTRGRRARVTVRHALLPGGVSLYGYLWADEAKSRRVIDPETGPVVQRIYDEILHGRSLRTIAKGLTDDGVPTPSQAQAVGKRTVSDGWNRMSIKRILRNPAYKGEAYSYQKKVVKSKRLDEATGRVRTVKRETPGEAVRLPDGTVPALVSVEVWEQTQERLDRNKNELSGNVSEDARQLLLRSGFIVCGHCGRTMHVGKTKEGRRTYVCGSRFGNARTSCGGGVASLVDAEAVESDTWAKVLYTLNTDVIAHALLNRTNGQGGTVEGLVLQL